MQASLSALGIFLLGLTLGACAGRSPYGDAKLWLEEIDPGQGRIFVYRHRNPLTMLYPFTFVLDGKEVADFHAGTGFFRDVKAGKHTITYNRGRQNLEIRVRENERIFIKYKITTDVTDPTNMVVEVVPPNKGDREMERTILIEGTLPIDRGPRIYF